jgi:hypothetical protein
VGSPVEDPTEVVTSARSVASGGGSEFDAGARADSFPERVGPVEALGYAPGTSVDPDRRPFIRDPAHLSAVGGTAYLCVRPSGPVLDLYEEVQAWLRRVVGEEDQSWPGAHMSIHGFGTVESPLDEPAEARIIALARGWAARTPPLRVEVEGLHAFSEDQIPVVRIRDTPELSSALRDIRTRAREAGVASNEDAISANDWIFHLSLAYYQGDHWPEIESALQGRPVPEVGCLADEAELVGFRGGPERLLARLRLAG